MKNNFASSSTDLSRRAFLRQTTLATAGATLASQTPAASAAKRPENKTKFCTFIKPFQELSYDELADTIAELGFDGIEATVRNKGHVLPENVETDLPDLVKALEKRNLSIFTMASDINAVTDAQRTETVLKTAADLGVPSYRMSYYKYDLSGATPLEDQLESFKKPLAGLMQLNDQLGIQALYQNHSGANYVGANMWDLYYLMRDYPKELFGSGFDIGHALVEGGKAWSQSLTLMLPRIQLLYVKGPAYRDNQIEFGPLDESALDHKKLFGILKKGGFTGPYNLHVEYHMKSDDKLGDTLKATPRDFATLKQWLANA